MIISACYFYLFEIETNNVKYHTYLEIKDIL